MWLFSRIRGSFLGVLVIRGSYGIFFVYIRTPYLWKPSYKASWEIVSRAISPLIRGNEPPSSHGFPKEPPLY